MPKSKAEEAEKEIRRSGPLGEIKAYLRALEPGLVRDKKLRFRLGEKAKETVAKRFLLTRYLEQYLDLFNSFEVLYRLKKKSLNRQWR